MRLTQEGIVIDYEGWKGVYPPKTVAPDAIELVDLDAPRPKRSGTSPSPPPPGLKPGDRVYGVKFYGAIEEHDGVVKKVLKTTYEIKFEDGDVHKIEKEIAEKYARKKTKKRGAPPPAPPPPKKRPSKARAPPKTRTPPPKVAPPKAYPCRGCGFSCKSLRGRQIHEGACDHVA